MLRAALLLLGACLPLAADVGSLAVSSDLDGELARGADLLEAGQRADGERVLEEVRRRAGQRAWDARVDLLLALDDERRGNFAAAIDRLSAASAQAIGLESYRRERLARILAAAGRDAEAVREYRALEEEEGPYAGRARAALAFARLLEKTSPSSAEGVLARAAETSPACALAVAPERLRLALASGDTAAARALARQILIEAPLIDRSESVSVGVLRALRAEEIALPPADRARRGRALVAAGDAKRGVALLARVDPARWPAEERDDNLLALARGQARLGHADAARATAARIPADGSLASFEARLLRLQLLRSGRGRRSRTPAPFADAQTKDLAALTSPEVPVSVRVAAREQLIRAAFETDRFDDGLEQARALAAESPGTRAGFEPLWKLAWNVYLEGDAAGARARFASLAAVYAPMDLRRRLDYWTARCLAREGHAEDAARIFRDLAAGDPADLYALFARRRVSGTAPVAVAPLPDPSEATATFRLVDELLRLRMFVEASEEARQLPASRGRDLRLAESEFALGRFAAAAASAKRAFPEIGTAEEGRVPDGWRRLYYPIEEGGFLAERAREFRLDPAILRALVRQESLFEAHAKSRAGALGLTQLLPSTARSVARSVLRGKYRHAFLYDPGVNARLGAAYLRLLYDRFDDNPLFALAAYNGGPGRMAGVRKQNPGLEDDEIFESHPAYESRDYVRRVMLYAESYRQLYPE